MCVEYLKLTKDGMTNNYASGGLANKPVARDHIQRRTIERVWMNGRGYDGEFREYGESRTKGAAM